MRHHLLETTLQNLLDSDDSLTPSKWEEYFLPRHNTRRASRGWLKTPAIHHGKSSPDRLFSPVALPSANAVYFFAMRNVSYKTLLRIFLRTYAVRAAFNMRGLQNVGFIYVMEQGLAAIHKDSVALRKARNRYVRHYNCHPLWTPLVTGMFLHTENEISQGRMSAEAFAAIKDTAANSLSALGDSVIGGTFMVTWGLATASLVVAGFAGTAAALTLALFVMQHIFKLCVFVAGLRYGLTALLWLRRWDLINWGDKLKLCNALLLTVFTMQCVSQTAYPAWWFAAVPCAMFAAWLTARAHMPRTFLALLAAAALMLASKAL